MTDSIDRLSDALSDRYRIESELGAGGMAQKAVRRYGGRSGGTVSDVRERLKSALADRYTIESELGAGGMATVYLAEDLKHHRKVAVKVLRPFSDTSTRRARIASRVR